MKTGLWLVEFWWLKSGFSGIEGKILGVFGLWKSWIDSDCNKSIYKLVLCDKLRSKPQTEFKNIVFWIFESGSSEKRDFWGQIFKCLYLRIGIKGDKFEDTFFHGLNQGLIWAQKNFLKYWQVFDQVVHQVVMGDHRPGMTSERKTFYSRPVQSNESCTNPKTDLRNIAPSRSYGLSKFGTSSASTVGTKCQISKRLFFPWSLAPTTQVRNQIGFFAKICPFGNTVESHSDFFQKGYLWVLK